MIWGDYKSDTADIFIDCSCNSCAMHEVQYPAYRVWINMVTCTQNLGKWVRWYSVFYS